MVTEGYFIQLFCHLHPLVRSSSFLCHSIYLNILLRVCSSCTSKTLSRYPLPRITSPKSELSSYPLCSRGSLRLLLQQLSRASRRTRTALVCHCGTVRHGALATGIPSTRTPSTSTADIAGELFTSALISRVAASLKPSSKPKQADTVSNSFKACPVQTILRT